MDRRRLRQGYLWALLALTLLVVPAAGCQSLVFTVLYLAGYGDAQAEFDGLKGKTVVVVCRPPSTMQFQDPRVSRDLAAPDGEDSEEEE